MFNSLLLSIQKIIAAIAIFLASLFPAAVPPPPQPPQSAATTTMQVLAAPQTASSTATTTAQTAPKQKTAAKAPQPIQKPTPSPAPAPAAPSLDPEVVNTQTRVALVNVLCTTQAGGYFKPISGSGVFVDSRGVILTNAHVAQFFLLKDYVMPDNVQCVIRSGSPAAPMYTAKLLYLPPAWVNANASEIVSTNPQGTGENDYAFLIVTGTTNPNGHLPAAFPALTMTSRDPDVGDKMLIGGYPAGFLEGITIQENLYATSAFASVATLYAFKSEDTWVDLFSVPGTILSQAGSSGGAVVRVSDGKLTGIVATASQATTTGDRDLRAVTLDHINRSLLNAGVGGIEGLLSQDIYAESNTFNQNVAPLLTQKLETVLNAQ